MHVLYIREGVVFSEQQSTGYLFFFCPKSEFISSPLRRTRNDFTSSRSMVISLSSAFAFASAIRLSSSISSNRFFRSDSNALIRSIVLLKLLIAIASARNESVAFQHLRLLHC